MPTTQRPDNIRLIITDKFKDVNFSIRLITDNTEPAVTMRNLLAYLMIDRNETYPTKQAINLKTDELFALSFDVKTSAYGTKHVLEMKFNTLSERYSKEAHLKDSFDFIKDCLTKPLINEETLAEAKINLRSNLKRMADKPGSLAAMTAYGLGGRGEPLSVFSQGRLDLVDSITVDGLKAYHQRILVDDDVFIVGIGQFDPAYRTMLERFVTRPKSFDVSSYCVSEKPFKEETLNRKVKQTALVSLYALGIDNTDPSYMAMRIMSSMLGQLPNSLLFTEIREKRNLCYSIYTNLQHYDGVLSIHTGISKQKRDLVLSLIAEQIDAIAKDEAPDLLFQSAKALMINNYQGIEDDIGTWMNLQFSAWLLNKPFDLQRIMAEIQQVDRQAVADAAKRLILLCTVTVKGQE